MALTPGTRLGIYQITAAIGEGGMGQVFRARDTKLDRDVAIKILPEAFAHDADRLARFTREAKTLASLNHPHIAGIHGLEESDGFTALVMELVEGDDLSQRIARGAIPIEEALPIAKQIAEALEAAHEQGIIHRDLKPANIKVRSDGTVKVLDFGLAKATESQGSGLKAHDMTASPTITSPAMTAAGMILGTAAYMSPEQAKGRPVDRRADIWAFGCVLYEMLTGMRPFPGEDITDTIVSVVSKEPDWSALPAAVPARVTQALRVCLRKDAKQRAQAIGDVRLALDGAFETAAPTTAMATASAPRARVAWMVAAAAVVGMAALAIPAVRYLRETPPPLPPETRVDIVTPATEQPSSFALSPDGRQIAFVASADGDSRLWVRPLAMTAARPLQGTEGASIPFWSPDGRSLGFFAAGALKRIDLGGDSGPQTLAPAGNGVGGAWNADGVIVFAPNLGRLMRLSAAGGVPTTATTIGPQQASHRWPKFLPDGRRFLFFVFGTPDVLGIYLGSLDGTDPVRLTTAESAGEFVPGPTPDKPGWLIWARAGALVAQRLDVAGAVLTGDPVTLADDVLVPSRFEGAVSVATGSVAYRAGKAGRRQLIWVDRTGAARGTIGEPDDYSSPRLFSDGRRVVVVRRAQTGNDLWLLDGARASRLTFNPTNDQNPVLSPDGARVAFHSNRTGKWDIYARLTSGAGTEERLVASEQTTKVPTSWSSDGRFLLYSSSDPQTTMDLWVLGLDGARAPVPFLKTPFVEHAGAFSPDGRWVAYNSNESGRNEVYVRPFVLPSEMDLSAGRRSQPDVAGGQWQVSTMGGTMPLWRRDGQELSYLSPTGTMMAAPIAVNGVALVPGTPIALFSTRIADAGVDSWFREYDVASDGRFLINTELPGDVGPIRLILNWNPEAKP